MRIAGFCLLLALAFAARIPQAAAETLPLEVADTQLLYAFPQTTTLNLTLTPASTQAFAAFSERHAGKTVDLKIDGKVLISPRLTGRIDSGIVSISGNFAPGRLEAIARRIAGGATTVDVETRD